jgi:tetratricopeptide (TPR) repeat protein
VATGRQSEAIEVFEKGMFVSKTALSEHTTSQFLQWHAYASALIGNKDQALQNIETSASLRAESGGLFYVSFNLAIRGATFLALGNYRQARDTLREALQIAASIPSPYIRACCLAYLALVDSAEEKIDSASGLIQEWVALMKINNYRYFWGWEPKSMSRLLRLAVELGIETDFVQTCAREQLGIVISPQADPMPLITIRVLGDFSIGIGTTTYMGPQDLSATHRELIGLLLSSPGQRLSREQVQLVFWPDSPPEKARTTYDTLMTRLRKALEKKLPEPATNYISVGKGYVQLTNVSIDAVQFMNAARSGLSFCKQDFWWQAENAFAKALSCWNLLQLNEIFTTDQALDFYDQIQNTLRDMCLTWSLRLVGQRRYDEALAILDNTKKVLSLEEDCIALRYQLYMKKHNPLKARDVLANYRQELLRLEYSNQEADELIASLIEHSSPL